MKTAHARMARILAVMTLVSGLSLVATQHGRGAPAPSAPTPMLNPCAPFSAPEFNDQSRGVDVLFHVKGIGTQYPTRHLSSLEGISFSVGGDFSMQIGGRTVRSGCRGGLFIILEARDDPSRVAVLQTCALLVSTSSSNPVSFFLPEATLADLKPTRTGDFTFFYFMSGTAGRGLRCSR